MGQRNADRVIDPRGAGEGGIEALAIQLAHQLEARAAWDLPMEIMTREMPLCLTADMDGEGRRDMVEELLGVIVGEDDP